MKVYIKDFILAFQFMTRIPIPISIDIDRSDFKNTVKFFPIVGLAIGIFEFTVYFIFLNTISYMFAAFATVMSHIFITGGIHIDGLSDTVDGIFSGRDRQRILEIMKDSRIGTFGCIAIVILIVGKTILLSQFEMKAVIAIILAPVISRTMNIFLMYKRKYARSSEGMGDMFIGVLDFKNYILALILGILISISIGKATGIMLISISCIFTFIFRKYIENKIDGITGDILGASDELNEFLIYLIVNIVD